MAMRPGVGAMSRAVALTAFQCPLSYLVYYSHRVSLKTLSSALFLFRSALPLLARCYGPTNHLRGTVVSSSCRVHEFMLTLLGCGVDQGVDHGYRRCYCTVTITV